MIKKQMPTTTRLPRTPMPYLDESLKGLILRAAEENGYYSSSMVLMLSKVRVDTKTQRTLLTKERFEGLSETLNMDIPVLKEIAALSGIEETPPKSYNMFGHRIHHYSVRTTSPRVCPKCLQEKNYARKIWDLTAYTSCPRHKALLIDECPRCGRKISWSRGRVNACHKCGYDWRYVIQPEIPEAELALSRLILKACGLWESGENGEEDTRDSQNPLSTVGLSELLCAAYFIAGLQHGVVDMTGKHYAVKLSHKELHAALANAMPVFENWPENYFKFLDECRGKGSVSTGHRQSGLYKDFGKLYDPLFIRKDNPLPDFMREAFKKYILTRWDGGYAGWCGSISSEELKERKYMTRHEVTKYMKISLHAVNLLHRKGYLKGEYLPWVNRSRIMIEAESARELKERLDNSISAKEAGDMLGIGRIAVVSLVKSGCLSALQGPAVTGQLEWRFETPEIEKLMKSVEEKIPQESIKAPSVGFHKAIQKLSKLSLDTGGFVRLILDGNLTPAAKAAGIGLSAFLFNEEEIERFSREEAAKRRGTKRTMSEAAKFLASKMEECVFLVEKGFLTAEREAGGRGGTWVITQEELDRFSGIYTSINYLVEPLNTSTKGLTERLMANGIMPVTGPKIDGGRKYFFRKDDLEAADFSKVLPNVKNSTIERMNGRGLISKKQLADLAGCSFEDVGRFLKSGMLVPALIERRRRDWKFTRAFFTEGQIEFCRKLIEQERCQLILFGNRSELLAA